MIALVILFLTGIFSLFAAFLKKSNVVLAIVIIGILAAIGALVNEWFNPFLSPYYPGIEFTHYSTAFSIVTLVITLLVCIVAYDRYKHHVDNVGDYYGLLIFSACGALCLYSFTDLFMLFIGIEILSIPVYVLAGSKKTDLRSNEAALKYFLMGSFATGIILFGIALIYGSTGSFNLHAINTMASMQTSLPVMFYVGMIMVLCAMCFKVGAAPFHFWGPDVYTGSPTIITSFMATVVKMAAFGAFIKLFFECFGFTASMWAPTLAVIAAITMTIGNITAVVQDNFKRMLAYSSIAHVGYILLALVSNSGVSSMFNLMFYLTSYSIATLMIFTIYIKVKNTANDEGFNAFKGLGKTSPMLAFAMVVGIISLAGIPPTSGFFGKYFLFADVLKDYSWLVVIAILNSAISIYYYFKIITAMYFTDEENKATINLKLSAMNTGVVLFCTVVLFALGIFSGFLLELMH